MKFKISLGILLLALLLAGAEGAQSPQRNLQIPTSKVGDVIKGVSYRIDQGRSFQLISIPTLEKKYLFVALTADEIYAHLELNLTLYKQGAQTPLKKCVKQEVDACYIARELLTPNETLFVVVDSGSEEIEYELRTYWSDLQHIYPGDEVKFMFSKQEKRQIYHLELEGQEFKELRIIIKPETRRFAFDKIKMYGTFGKDSLPSADQHDFKSVYLWEDAEGIYLSRKEIKDLSMNFILEGEIETVYILRCDLVTETHHELKLNSKIYEYLDRDESYVYYVNFQNAEGKLQYDAYVLTIAGFTGQLDLEFYKDKQVTERLQSKEPFMYMGDVQYALTKEQIEAEMKNGLYIKAFSKNKISTFMMEIEGRSKSKLFQIHEHIFEFMPVQKQTLSYFKVAKFEQGTANKANLKVVFSLIQVIGKAGIEFRKCNSTQENCTGELYRAHSQKIESEYRSVGSKQTYTITLSQDFWKNVNIVEKNAIILVVLTNRQEKSSSFAAVEYNVGNRPQFLRQNKPIQSHVLKNEMKVYKFTTTDQSIEKVRIHINKISGCFSTYVFRHEPTEEQLVKDVNKVSGALHEESLRLTDDPIVVVIKGQDSATYSLIVQPVHKSSNDINYITLSQDVEFKIKIGPNKYEVFEIVPIMNNVFYNYKSTGAIHACVLKHNVCEDKQANFTNEGLIQRANFGERSLYVKLRNPSSTKSIEVSSIFHSRKQNHCQQKKIGQLYKEVVKEGSCFITAIDTAQDFEVLIAREEMGHLSYTMALCDKLLNFAIKESGEERYVISKEQITVNCQGHSEYNFVFAANGGKQFNPDKPLSIHLKYLIEFTSSTIILPDGIGYHGSEVTTEEPLKKFVFPLLNKIDTSIILSTEYKLYFLVKFAEAGSRSQAVLNINSYDLASPSEKFYFLQSIFLKISEEQMKKYTCRECELLIYVYSKQKVGTVVDYTIEITQNFVKLEEGAPKTGYLIQNSKAYYGYTIKNSGSLLVEVNDNNLNCAELYLSSLEYPDENRHMEKSFDGQIIFDVSQSTSNYYITVRARKTCAYTITAALTQGKNHIVKLERGVLGYCNLAENDVKLYTFKHLSDQAFKIISLHKYGHVEFYLNKTTPDEILTLMRKEKVDLQAFTYHSDFKNRLVLDKSKPEFCKGCYYILAVQAKKHTESSIFLGDESTKIPLSESKVINDILSKTGMSTRGEFSYFKKGALEIKVHSGKLQVQIIFKDQSIKKTFEKSKSLITYNFTLNQEEFSYGAVSIIFTALEDSTVYSSRVKSADSIEETSDGNQYILINANEPNYLYLNKEELTCMKGFLKRADERIFISFYSQDKQEAKQMKIVAKINDNYTQISQDTTRNVISIAFIDAANQQIKEAIPYELCLSHDTQSLSLTIMQTEETSLLPENLQVLVVNKQTYDIYPEGNFLLDVFECRGTTKISYGSTKKLLDKSKPKVLDMIGMPDQPHAVRLQQGYSNLLLGVEGEMALIRWIRINEQQHKGLGYYLYSAGSLKYNSAFGEIQFLVEPVKNLKKTKTKIKSSKYTLYISNNQEDLKQASLCERYLPGSVIQYKINSTSILNSTFKYAIHKTNLMQKYKEAENLFVNIVADLTIKTPDETEEQYRFIYKSQEVPAVVFLPNQLEKYDLTTLIVALVLFIVALLIFTWVFTKVIVPLIGRLRNRLLIEEHGAESSKDKKEDEKQDYIEPPPSSDRQGIAHNDLVVPETQQRM